jgi:murein DD-endopeptidase MepM/ murein hydrolase activator NlpD
VVGATLIVMMAIGPALELPWPCGEAYRCTQASGGVESHSGFGRHAWDFAMPLGVEVVAARGGTVSMIEMDSQVGGCSSVYADDANYVLIDHHDGSAGLYLHLEGRSSELSVGDRVAAGDVIARVGQTGWSCGPHLHFQVQELCGSWWCQSLPSSFPGIEVSTRGEPIAKPECGSSAIEPDTEPVPIRSAEPRPSSSRAWLLALLAPLGLGLAWRHRRR